MPHAQEAGFTSHLDKTGMVLSVLCMIHCLILPLFLTIFPLVSVAFLADDRFHRGLLLFILPTAVLALYSGCRRHRKHGILLLGVAGMGVLMLTAYLGQAALGTVMEKAATVSGGVMLVLAHLTNFRECRRLHCEDCTSTGA